MPKNAFKVSIGGFSHHKKSPQNTKLPKLDINIGKIFFDKSLNDRSMYNNIKNGFYF